MILRSRILWVLTVILYLVSPTTDASHISATFGLAKDSPLWTDKVIAIFTAVLAIVSIVQGIFLWLGFRASSRAARIAEQALSVTERAYLTIDSWMITDFNIGSQPQISYELVNNGHTGATITSSIVKFIVGAGLPEVPDYGGHPVRTPAHVRGGGKITGRVDTAAFGVLNEGVYNAVMNGESELFVWGKIIYRDVFGNDHETGFAAVYTPARGSFAFVNMPGYDYAN